MIVIFPLGGGGGNGGQIEEKSNYHMMMVGDEEDQLSSPSSPFRPDPSTLRGFDRFVLLFQDLNEIETMKWKEILDADEDWKKILNLSFSFSQLVRLMSSHSMSSDEVAAIRSSFRWFLEKDTWYKWELKMMGKLRDQ